MNRSFSGDSSIFSGVSTNENTSSTKTSKMKNERKSPNNSATKYPEGTIDIGNDNHKWVVKKNKKGIKHWVLFHSTILFGYAPLTAKILKNNINKPIMVYERQSENFWPKSKKDFDVKYLFTSSGDAELVTKDKKENIIFSNWLKNKKYIVKKNDIFIIKGTMKSNDIDSTIQVSPLPDELVSTNLMNTHAFVKI